MMVRMTLKNLKAIPSIVLLWKRECGKFYASKCKTIAKMTVWSYNEDNGENEIGGTNKW